MLKKRREPLGPMIYPLFPSREDLYSCVKNENPTRRGEEGKVYFAGLDLGRGPDISAVAIGHFFSCGRIVLDQLFSRTFGSFEEMSRWVREILSSFDLVSGFSDMNYVPNLPQKIEVAHPNLILQDQILNCFLEAADNERLTLYKGEYLESLLRVRIREQPNGVLCLDEVPGVDLGFTEAISRMVYSIDQYRLKSGN